ncbi:MAG: hypothetical protein ACK5M4_05240 [Pseudorhodobacter sp.]
MGHYPGVAPGVVFVLPQGNLFDRLAGTAVLRVIYFGEGGAGSVALEGRTGAIAATQACAGRLRGAR